MANALRRMVGRAVWVVAAVGLAVGVPAAQQAAQEAPVVDAPPVTFRVAVNFVEVDAYVTDAAGNPVTGLTADDFEIFEDGVPQTIDTFTHVNIPIERAERPLFATGPIEPDVQANTATEGRLYVFVIDDYHISQERVLTVKMALSRFIEEHMGVNDVAAVVYLNGQGTDGQDFTNKPRLLLASVDKLVGRKLPSPTAVMTREFNRPAVQALLESGRGIAGNGPGDLVQDPLEFERTWRARNAFDMIHDVAEFMEGVRGRRKALILVSEGLLFNVYDPFSASASAVLDESREAIAAATRANVTIYALDPRGLFVPSDLVLAANNPAADSGRISEDSPQLNIGLQSLSDEFRLSQQSLMVLAERTGGFAAVNRNDLTDVFDRIVRENSAYYVLGYYSSNEDRDGDYRRLEVRVRRPSLQVRARDGYVAPRGRAPELDEVAGETPRQAGVREALTSPLSVTGLPVTVFASAYRGPAPNAIVPVVVEIDASDLSFVEREDGTFGDSLTVTLVAAEGDGDLIASNQHELSLALRPDTLERVQARGLRVVSELSLPPGRHRVRVAVADETGRVGSVAYDLDVPEYDEILFEMAGVTLTTDSAEQTFTVEATEPMAQLLPGVPIATRTFVEGDLLSFFTEVYENAEGLPEHTLDFSATLLAEDGRAVFRSEEQRSSAELVDGRGGFGYTGDVPLDVVPGFYVLRIEVRSSLSRELGSLARDILVRVEPDPFGAF